MIKDRLSTFLETYDKPYTIALIQDTKHHLNQHIEAWTDQFTREIDTFFTQIITYQKQNPINLTSINLSFLYTSLYFKQPQFKLDTYEEDWLLTPSRVEGSLDASILFAYIETYKKNLQKAAEKEGVARLLREEKMKVLIYDKVNILLYMAIPYIKYMAPQWQGLKSFQHIKKSDTFYLSIGAYRDWQRVIGAVLPEVDIFYCEEGIPLRFRAFKNKRYKKKTFENLDLSCGTFTDCVFLGSTFKQVNLNDCVFENCIFYDLELVETSLLGVTFRNCQMKGAKWDKLVFSQEHLPKEDIKDLYKDPLFEDCQFENIHIQETGLNEIQLVGCEVDASDIAKLLEEQKEE